jgi:DNA-binding transcriptional regulator/RsmH inhibitor MraZ
VLPLPPTSRLSPKNQVTLPREARALRGDVGHVRALAHWMPGKADRTLRHRVVLLMTEAELTRRERAIADAVDLKAEDKLVLMQQLNAGAAHLAIDDQRRVVLPTHLVEYLALEREVLFVSTNDLIFTWNPAEFARWSTPDPGAGGPDLNRFLAI